MTALPLDRTASTVQCVPRGAPSTYKARGKGTTGQEGSGAERCCRGSWPASKSAWCRTFQGSHLALRKVADKLALAAPNSASSSNSRIRVATQPISDR